MKSELELQKEFINNPELQDQINYLKTNPMTGMEGFMMIEAFVTGIREFGYKDSSFAFCELNDNSLQAGARNIHYDLIGKKNIEEIVVYDDGHGMLKDMLRIAVNWGGSHRAGSRKGFGKYGFGLPSACMGMAKKYTIYSKTIDGEWNNIIFDTSHLHDKDDKPDLGNICSTPQACELPPHIANFEGTNLCVKELSHGTIIQVEHVDRVTPVQINNLKDKFLSDFGQTYFKLLETCNIFIDNKKVEPVDVLFATPGAKGFKDDINDLSVDIDNSECYDEVSIPITMEKNGKEIESEITVRWSALPSLFAIRNPSDSGYESVEEAYINNKTSQKADPKSFRMKVMKQNFGIVFRRYGRRMEVVSKRTQLGDFNCGNNSNYWKCEVNFPAELDEHFDVTTSKQHIIPSQKIIKTLEEAGIFRQLKNIEKRYYDYNQVLKSKISKPPTDSNQPTQAEIVAAATALAEGSEIATSEHEERTTKSEERKKQRIEQIAADQNISIQQAATDYEAKFKDRPRVCTEASLGRSSPFISFDEHGNTIEVVINIDHSFYKTFYCGNGSNTFTQSSWQLFFILMAAQYYKHGEDHKDFLQSFFNNVGHSMKTASRKDFERNPEEKEVLDDEIL